MEPHIRPVDTTKVLAAVDECLAACRKSDYLRDTFDAMLARYAAEPGWTMGELFELRRRFIDRVMDRYDHQVPSEISASKTTVPTAEEVYDRDLVDGISVRVVERCRASGRPLSALVEILEVLRADPKLTAADVNEVCLRVTHDLTTRADVK